MKKTPWLSLTLGAVLIAGTAGAQTIVTTESPASYSGVVSEINPTASTIILKSESAPAPVTYTYTPQTVFVDSAGNTVAYETIRNVPVTVEYSTVGGRTVVSRVVATSAAPGAVIERKETTKTETGPGGMIERRTTTRTETEVR